VRCWMNLRPIKNFNIDIKNRAVVLMFLVLLISSTTGYAHRLASETETIKIALLDCPYNEMPLIPFLSEYEKAYFAGVETAARVAKKYNIKIEYKPFIYNKGALDILAEIPIIKRWGANLVIGPNSSDQFILLRNSFRDVMVLSAYASGDALQTLPGNFYSTFLPDSRIIALLSKSVKIKFPQKNIYIIVQADCKQCVDASQLFIKNYKKISPDTQLVVNKIIMDNINTIDSKKLMTDHIDNVTLVFNSSYYDYNVFVNHITASFPGKNLIFFSDQDNWSNEVDGQTHQFDLIYESYRIGPVLFDYNSPRFKKFANAYYEIYHQKPRDAISYLTYVSVISAVEALHQFSMASLKKGMNEKLLNSYFAALKKNPNWFRTDAYGIYRLTSNGEVLVDNLTGSH